MRLPDISAAGDYPRPRFSVTANEAKGPELQLPGPFACLDQPAQLTVRAVP